MSTVGQCDWAVLFSKQHVQNRELCVCVCCVEVIERTVD